MSERFDHGKNVTHIVTGVNRRLKLYECFFLGGCTCYGCGNVSRKSHYPSFAVGPVFRILRQTLDGQGNRLIHVITRAKSNVVAYEDPRPGTWGTRKTASIWTSVWPRIWTRNVSDLSSGDSGKKPHINQHHPEFSFTWLKYPSSSDSFCNHGKNGVLSKKCF